MAARKFIPSQHPRDRFGRFTRSRSAQASADEKQRATAVATGLKPKRGVTGVRASAYLSSIALAEHRGVVAAYTGGGYVDTHKALRAGQSSNAGVAAMDAAMVELPDDLIVSRRVPAAQFGSVDVASLVGLKVKDAAYAPTSIGAVRPTKGDVRIRIAVPKGTRAAVDPDTGEVVLDRNLEMVVAGVEPNPAGSTDVFLTILPKPSAEPAEVPDSDGLTRSELMRLRVPELQARMRERGLKPGRLRKSQLVDALMADEVGGPQPETEPAQTAPFEDRVSAAAAGQAALDAPALGVSRRPRPEEHAEALRNVYYYTGPEYNAINRHLRGQPLPYGYSPDDVEPTVTAIDQAMQASQLQTDVMVWRGLLDAGAVFGADRVSGDLTGFSWQEDAYLSTTANDKTARRFTASGPAPLMMRILAPAGTPAVEASDMRAEAEVLLGRGQQLRVVADRGVDARGVRIIDVEVTGAGR